MRVAILGMLNSGKRTIFKLLTARTAPAVGQRRANEVVSGLAPVRDPRVDKIASIVKPEKITYAQTEFVLCGDIDPTTTLAKGSAASGNWITDAKLCDLLCIVVRDFESEDVYHPLASIDSRRDQDNLQTELLLADLELLEKRLERISKEKGKIKMTAKQQTEEQTLQKFKPMLEASKLLSTVELTSEELASVNSLNFLTLKRILWCYNIDESKIASTVGTAANTAANKDFFVSAKIEQEIMEIQEVEERNQYLTQLGLHSSGIDRLNAAAYDSLGLMSFYTMGKDEARAWTITKGTQAPKAAGKIHSDLERGFIRVEVIKYQDLVKLGSEQAIRTNGKFMVKGQDYIIEDGDICNFLFKV